MTHDHDLINAHIKICTEIERRGDLLKSSLRREAITIKCMLTRKANSCRAAGGRGK